MLSDVHTARFPHRIYPFVVPSLLQEAHDIGESLQKAIERLPQVDRAFVHLDKDADHSASDEHKSL